MKIEAVIVCINYADFLKITLPANKHHFDRLVIVTDEQDTETAKVCEFYNVQCIKTNAFYTDGSTKPNKALGINEGLKVLDKDGWVLHMDADIWLPPLARQILENHVFHSDCIYGIDRLMCNSYQEWIDFIHMNDDKKSIHEGWIYLHMHYFPVGQRIVQYQGDGYMPIGFFQFWNPKVSGVYTYPVENVGFDRTDVLHLKQFPREKRKFIPELVCVHLASEETYMGQNWNGRTSKKFLPEPPQPIHKKMHKHLKNLAYALKNGIVHIYKKCKRKKIKSYI